MTEGIISAFYINRGQSKVVLYQYKYIDPNEETEGTSIFISFTDSNFKMVYELSRSDFGPNTRSELFRLYKLIQRKANNVDQIIEDFISDFKEKPDF